MAPQKETPAKQNDEYFEELLRHPNPTLTLTIASVNGVVGILGITDVFDGHVVSPQFQPLTPELAKKLNIASEFEAQLKAQKSRAEALLKSGNLDNCEWLKDHLKFIDGTDTPEARQFFKLLDEVKKDNPINLARIFSKTEDISDLKVLFTDNLGESVFGAYFKDQHLVSFKKENFSTFISDELLQFRLDEAKRTLIEHEFDHAEKLRVPDLNARQEALLSGVINETSAHWAEQSRLWNEYFPYAKRFDSKTARALFERLKIPEETIKELMAAHQLDQALQLDGLYLDQKLLDCRRTLCEKFLIEDFKKQLSNELYRTQMFEHALKPGDPTGQGNLAVMEKYVKDLAERHLLNPEAAERVWTEIKPYASGEKELPLLKGLIQQDGTLTQLPRELLDLCSGRNPNAGSNLKFLAEHWDNPEAIINYFSPVLSQYWLEGCPAEFKTKLQKAGYEILTDTQYRHLKQILRKESISVLNNFDEMTGERLTRIENIVSPEVRLAALGLMKKGQFEKLEAELLGTVADIRSGKIKLDQLTPAPGKPTQTPTAGKPTQEPVQARISTGVQPVTKPGRIRQTLQKANRWTQETPQGALTHAAGTLALNGAAMWAANKIGRQFRSYEDVEKEEKMRMLFEEEIEKDVSVQKAQTLLAASGMVVGTASVGFAIASKMALKNTARGAVIIGAKSLPFVGAILSAGCAIPRAIKGDWTGVGMELSSAAMDLGSALCTIGAIPSFGATSPLAVSLTASSAAMNVAIAARDGIQKNGIISLAMVDENGEIVLSQQTDKDGNRLPVVGATITYSHDKRNGDAVWRGLDKNGKEYVAQTGSFKNDKKDGRWVTRSEDGLILEIANYKDDKLVGKYMRCDKNGRMIAMGDYTNGHFVEYWTDSEGNATDILKWEGDFKNGKPTGIRRDYAQDGSPLDVVDYDHGKMEYALLDADGHIVLDKDRNPSWQQKEFEPRTQPKMSARMRREMGIHQPEPTRPHWNPRFDRTRKKPTTPTKVDKKPAQTQEPQATKPETQPQQVEPQPIKPQPVQEQKKPEPAPSKPVPTQTEPAPAKPTPTSEQHRVPPQEPPRGGGVLITGTPSSFGGDPTVITQDGRVWQKQNGRFKEVGRASSTDTGVHVQYNGDYIPPSGKPADLVVQKGANHYETVDRYSEANDAGTYWSQTTNTPPREPKRPRVQPKPQPVPEQKKPEPSPAKPTPAPAPTPRPTQPPRAQHESGGSKPTSKPSPVGKVDPRKQPKRPTTQEAKKPSMPTSEAPKPAPVQEPKPAPAPEAPKPAPAQEPKPAPAPEAPKPVPTQTTTQAPAPTPAPAASKPAPTQPPKPTQPARAQHESGGQKPTSKPSSVGKVDPRKQPKRPAVWQWQRYR